jgi:CHAT domain-containing protein/tetratricopeptide (TPR) repeat protein
VYRSPAFLSKAFFLVVLLVMARGAASQEDWQRRQSILNDANSLRSQAELALTADRLTEAEQLMLRAVDAVEKGLGPNHREMLFFREALGRVYRRQGRLPEAEAQYVAAIRSNPEGRLPALLELGEIALQAGHLDESEKAFTDAMGLQTSDSGYRQRAYGGLGAVAFHRRLWRTSAEYWSREAGEIVSAVRGSTVLSMQVLGAAESRSTVGNEAAFYGFVRSAYRAVQQDPSLREEMSSRAFELAQWVTMSRAGEAVNQMGARYGSQVSANASRVRERQDLASLWRSLSEKRGQLRDAGQRDSSEYARIVSEMRSVDARLASIDSELGDRLPSYVNAAMPEARSLKQVRASLRRDEVLIFIVTVPAFGGLPGETFLWAIGRDDVEWRQSDLDGEAIDGLVTALRCGVDRASWGDAVRSRCERMLGTTALAGSPLPFDPRRAYELYRRLFSKSRLVDSSRNLLVVASGALTKLPLHLLVTREPSKEADLRKLDWLVLTKAVSSLPTVSSLIVLRSSALKSRASQAMIGFGNPVLSGHPTATAPPAVVDAAANLARRRTSCAAIGGGVPAGARDLAELSRNGDGLADLAQIRSYQPLPETADELCAVAASVRASQRRGDEARIDMFLAGNATETTIKNLSQSGELAKYRILYFATHGVMASRLRGVSEPGLVLTPPDVASAEDDGFLSSSEIATLKIDAEWVVLSACNTAAGTAEADEPLSGIAQAFFYAQSRALLISHWAVDSEAAVALTTATFRKLADGNVNSRAEALRSAMEDLIKGGDARFAHPQMWSPFVFAGDPAM